MLKIFKNIGWKDTNRTCPCCGRVLQKKTDSTHSDEYRCECGYTFVYRSDEWNYDMGYLRSGYPESALWGYTTEVGILYSTVK
jgi:hypothetical protein